MNSLTVFTGTELCTASTFASAGRERTEMAAALRELGLLKVPAAS